jgi:hypothetical protein
MGFDDQAAHAYAPDVMNSRILGDDANGTGADLIFKIILDRILPPKRIASPERRVAVSRRRRARASSERRAAAPAPSNAGPAQSAGLG